MWSNRSSPNGTTAPPGGQPLPRSAACQWSSDGSEAGTSRLLDIGSPTSSSPREIRVVNGRLVFVANGGARVSTELWVSDGTTAGTFSLRDQIAATRCSVRR